MRQLTLATAGFDKHSKQTRRTAFLAEMEQVVPWCELCAVVEPLYPKPCFGKLAPTEVVLEARCGSHHWARALGCLGHRVKLIPPQYVKPFVKRAKNDRKDAEAISEAAARPSMRSVPVKTVEQQAETILVKHREMLVSQQTQAINALRGHAV
jgi:transposase